MDDFPQRRTLSASGSLSRLPRSSEDKPGKPSILELCINMDENVERIIPFFTLDVNIFSYRLVRIVILKISSIAVNAYVLGLMETGMTIK